MGILIVDNKTSLAIGNFGGGGGGTISSIGNLPAPGNEGSFWKQLDGRLEAYDDGTNWNFFFQGIPVKLISDQTGFTWVNQGDATFDDSTGIGILTKPGQASPGSQHRVRTKAAPATPFTIEMLCGFKPQGGTSFTEGALGFRESSTGKLLISHFSFPSTALGYRYFVQRWTDETTFNVSPSNNALSSFRPHLAGPYFLKIEDNGTNLLFSLGDYLKNYVQYYSVSRTAWMAGGPDEVCFSLRNDSTDTTATSVFTIFSWVES